MTAGGTGTSRWDSRTTGSVTAGTSRANAGPTWLRRCVTSSDGGTRAQGRRLAVRRPSRPGSSTGSSTIAAAKVRPSTLARYRQLVTHQLAPKVGHHRLDRLQPEHVERMYAELLAAGLSPASVLQAHRVLSRALKVAMQRGRVARNVCGLVDAPSVTHSEVKPLTPDEARRVLRRAAGLRNGARWSVALALVQPRRARAGAGRRCTGRRGVVELTGHHSGTTDGTGPPPVRTKAQVRGCAPRGT